MELADKMSTGEGALTPKMKLLKSSTKYLEGLHDKTINSGNEQ